jgi:hypothetical protein
MGSANAKAFQGMVSTKTAAVESVFLKKIDLENRQKVHSIPEMP